MLLLPFIENCFKHGVSAKLESKIEIFVRQKGKILELKTVNLKFPSNPKSKENMGSGIGLTNTKRRLDLIYGSKCQLIIDEDNPENEYRTQLKIDLG